MANWWLDESPYPGPDASPTPEQVVGKFIVTTGRQYARLINVWTYQFGMAVKEAAEGLRTFVQVYNDWTEAVTTNALPTGAPPREDQRAWALYCQQNRNTGPRPEWQYSRDGRKDY